MSCGDVAELGDRWKPTQIEGPSVSMTDEVIVRAYDVQPLIQATLESLSRAHFDRVRTLPEPPEGHYWAVSLETEDHRMQNLRTIRVVYTLTPVAHEDWCHVVTGCIEPGHCTCNANGYAELARYRPAPLALEQLNW